MNIVIHVALGLLIIAGGVLLLKYNYQVANSLPLSFAEKHMGSGGSYLAWKLISILVVVIGLSVVFGVNDNILAWLLSPLANIFGGNSSS